MLEEKTDKNRLLPEFSYNLSQHVYADFFKYQDFSGESMDPEGDYFRSVRINDAVDLRVAQYSDLVRGTVLSIEYKNGYLIVVSADIRSERSDQTAISVCADTLTSAGYTAEQANTVLSTGTDGITVSVDCATLRNPPASPLAGRKIVIGMIGRAGSGKDTVADYLVRTCGFKKIAFADPLKKAVQIIFDVEDEIAYDRVKREQPLEKWPDWSFRKLLQFVGTEMFRNMIHQDIWVKNCASRATRQDLTVISDVRFPNEVRVGEYIGQEYRTVFVKVERDSGDGAPSGIANHASEVQVDDLPYNYRIVNDGTLEDLYRKVDDIVVRISIGV